MLVGGLAVIGLYEHSSSDSLLDHKTKTGVLQSLIKLCEELDSEITKRGSMLLLHISNNGLETSCRDLIFGG
jgi:hypothetical protein